MKKKKRKVRVTGWLFFILLIYLIGCGAYYFFTLPIKNIIVNGEVLLTEDEIIDAAGISVKKSFYKVSTLIVKNKVKKLDLVDNAKVKKSLTGVVTIDVEENKILFYNILSKKYILSNGREVDFLNYPGIPTLVNYVPSDNFDSFVKYFSKIDRDIISMISEIEYSPDSYNGVVTDGNRFLFRMNDGNKVYVNSINVEKMNKYQEIYSAAPSKGTLFLDSSSQNYIFKTDTEE